MKLKFFENQAFSRWICLATIAILPWLTVLGQSGGESTTEELIRLGFENVRWTENEAERIIDAQGKLVSPGFIDTHSHSDLKVLVEPFIEPKLRQGITTEVLGQD